MLLIPQLHRQVVAYPLAVIRKQLSQCAILQDVKGMIPLVRQEAGKYISEDNDFRIERERSGRWLIIYRSDPEFVREEFRIEWYTYATRYPTLKAAHIAVDAWSKGSPRPSQIRPLQKLSVARYYGSACGQFQIAHTVRGWHVHCLMKIVCNEKKLWANYLERHGIEIFMPTLSSLADRLDKACQIDPPEKLFEESQV